MVIFTLIHMIKLYCTLSVYLLIVNCFVLNV